MSASQTRLTAAVSRDALTCPKMADTPVGDDPLAQTGPRRVDAPAAKDLLAQTGPEGKAQHKTMKPAGR